MKIDLESRYAIDHPAEFFAEARRIGGDVQWSEIHRAWLVLSHAEVEAGFRDSDKLSSDKVKSFERVASTRSPAFEKVVEILSGWMNFRDPPAHDRLRKPVASAFTPRAIAELEPQVQEIVDSVIDEFPADGVDLNRDFARIVPALVIAAILGVEGDARKRFQDWSDDLAHLVFSMNPGEDTDDGSITRATTEFTEFFTERIERERSHPSGTLLTSVVENSGEELTALELVGACTLLLFGGHETTTILLSNAIALLMVRPDLQQWLREHPEADDTAPDEFVRIGGPARALPRKVIVAHERGGQQLEVGQNVYLCVAAANYDPAVINDPATVDLTRKQNYHLGFGTGLHYCLGATLAKMEARIAIRTLLTRYSDIRPDGPIAEVRASAMGFGRRPLAAVLTAAKG